MGVDLALAGYERLRRSALLGSGGEGRFGLVILLRDGLAAWMSEHLRFAPSDVQPALPVATTLPPKWSEQLQAGVASVLAGIALAARAEVSA